MLVLAVEVESENPSMVSVELYLAMYDTHFSSGLIVGRSRNDGLSSGLAFSLLAVCGLVLWLTDWSVLDSLLSWFEGSLIAFTTIGLVCVVWSLESPVSRAGCFHFVLAMRSMRAALVWWSMVVSVPCGVWRLGLPWLFAGLGLLNIFSALLVKFGSLKIWSRDSVLWHSAILWLVWFSRK